MGALPSAGSSALAAGAGAKAPAGAAAAPGGSSAAASAGAAADGQGGGASTGGGGSGGASGSPLDAGGAGATGHARGSGSAASAQPGATAAPLSEVSSSVGVESTPLSSLLEAQAQTDPAAAGAAAAPGSGSLPGAQVGMHEMIESIRATIEIAAKQGATQARIALEPEALGHISIRLSQTSAGLLARVSAETPAAAQALADGRSELHQSLSTLGLSLLRLDISSYGQSQAGEREGRFADGSGSAGTSRASNGSEEVDDAEGPGESGGAVSLASIPGGALVDVLA